MHFLYSFFFGAGVGAFVYTKLGRRVGYGNTRSVFGVVAAVFVVSTIFFFTILSFVMH